MQLTVIRRALEQENNLESYQKLAGVLGFQPQEHPINYLGDNAAEIHHRVSPVSHGLYRVGSYAATTGDAALWVAFLNNWGERSTDRDKARRRIIKALVELEPAGDRRILVALTADGVQDFELVLPRIKSDNQLGVIRALISRLNITHHHLELFLSLSLDEGMTSVAIARKWNEAFNVEKLTKRFYLEFRSLRNRVLEEVFEANPNNELIQIEENKVFVRRYITRNLGRILFLWFLQSKGWLDSDQSYFVNLYERRCRNNETHNYFKDTLIPLFFEALAKKQAQRSEPARNLGGVPFLNGGLFLQSHFEDKLYGEEREHLDVQLPNYLFDPRQHSNDSPTVLGLLNNYRFTTRESTPDDQSLDPDPELLGKVFENLNEESERAESGTFYTPREIVHFMCRETLDNYLIDKTGYDKETFDWLRQEAVDPEASNRRLAEKEREKIQKALEEVTVCDPAVGSGAFPVGMMHEILLLMRGLEQSTDLMIDIGGQRVAEWKEHIITKCLYGVDINPEAIVICHLRLWLSLVIDANEPIPLPNLDFRFVAGDSLIDRISIDPLKDSLPRETIQNELDIGEESSTTDLEKEIQELREEFTNTETPSLARKLRDRIKKKQNRLLKNQINSKIDEIEDLVKYEKKRLQELQSKNHSDRVLRTQENLISSLIEKSKLLQKIKQGLEPWASYKKPFIWPIEFPEIFNKKGFDIVVANPPYVRQEKITKDDQKIYEESFKDVYSGTADLLVYFYNRAAHILKDGGQLAFITSNKFMRANYGKKIRCLLKNKFEIFNLIDFGDLPIFDALAYPIIVTGRNCKSNNESEIKALDLTYILKRIIRGKDNIINVSTVREELENLNTYIENYKIPNYTSTHLNDSGWVIEDTELLELFEKLIDKGESLHKFVNDQMHYGVKTGFNVAYVIDELIKNNLINSNDKNGDLIKPWIIGSDIKKWCADKSNKSVIAIQSSTDANCKHKWKDIEGEARAREVFKEEYTAIHEHLSKFEQYPDPKDPTKIIGLRMRADQGKYWWELRSCAYYDKFLSNKIIWGNLSIYSRFAYDESGSFLAAPANFLVAPGPWLLGILNSDLLNFLYPKFTVTRSGGYQEFKMGYIKYVPIIEPGDSCKAKLNDLVLEATSSSSRGQNTTSIEEIINKEVFNLYGISENEIRLIAKWKENRDLLINE